MNFNCAFVKSLIPPSRTFNYQVVRWRRVSKPFWLGVAKSKKFVVPEPKVILTPEETKENRNLLNIYRTQLKSILNFIRVENPNLNETLGGVGQNEVKLGTSLEEKISKSWKSNENWNAETAKLREDRMKKSEEEQLETVIEKINENEKRKMVQMELIEEIVRKEKNLAKSYITPENLEEAVENCLNKVDCFDFAIDLEGNIYKGRDPLPSPASLTHNEGKSKETAT